MNLGTMLNFVKTSVCIILFDINGVEQFRCRTKESIPADLLEYDVLDISANWKDTKTYESALFITLQK